MLNEHNIQAYIMFVQTDLDLTKMHQNQKH